eukprot:10463023-Alexandrium_andersonii.AAC.1
MSASLVGSEMCIRDRDKAEEEGTTPSHARRVLRRKGCGRPRPGDAQARDCLLYTSDAADDM